SSYMPVSARASLLSAEVVTEEGGETEWADMRAAWDALDESRRERVAGLAAHHSLRYSQARAGFASSPGGAYQSRNAREEDAWPSDDDLKLKMAWLEREVHKNAPRKKAYQDELRKLQAKFQK